MGRERGRELLPLVQEPPDLLLGGLPLGGHRAHALTVRIERGLARGPPDLGEPRLERVDLLLPPLEPFPQFPQLGRRAPRATRGFLAGRPRRPIGAPRGRGGGGGGAGG